MKVDILARHRWFLDHIKPIWDELPGVLRGDIRSEPPKIKPRDRVTLVAGKVDVDSMAGFPVIYVEHGAGQTYVDLPANRHHAGGKHPNAIGYICPSERVAALWDGPAIAVGCPKLDRWLPITPDPEPRTVAVTWRWRPMLGDVCPEQLPALNHYGAHLALIVDGWRAQGWHVIGHGHPRAQRELGVMWRNLGIRPVWNEHEVIRRAGVVVGDNSSFLYEAAALRRTVITLNAPWYRRDVEHGLRFWDHIPGISIDEPEHLLNVDLDHASQYESAMWVADDAVRYVYAHTDGSSSRRAAAWIVSLLSDGDAVSAYQAGARRTRLV